MKTSAEQMFLMNVPTDRDLVPGSEEWARAELMRFQELCNAEGGLLRHAQAARILGCSVQNIASLVQRGRLSEFVVLGDKHVSGNEVIAYSITEKGKGGRGKRQGLALAA